MLPYTKQERKDRPMHEGALLYFPDAIAELARVSKVGNDQHNPGEPMHWAREKSSDHGDCIVRHQCEAGTVDDDGLLHSAKVFWRAGAQLQLELEERHAKGLPPFGPNPASLIESESWDPDVYEERTPARLVRPRVYIAGPMRGLPEFNFPAFDDAAKRLRAQGWDVISPADLDRAAPHQATTDEEASRECQIHEYMERDLTDTLLTFRKSKGDAIAMLPGWENSHGAVTEFMVARWAGLRILDATTGDPLTNFDARLLARAVADHLHFVNK